MFWFMFQNFSLVFVLNILNHVERTDALKISPRIFFASDVRIKDFPFYAGLMNCGAAILSENWVVTAAHCVSPDSCPNCGNFIWVGGNSFQTSKMVTFDKVVIHDGYVEKPITVNDIALLHLSKPLVFTDKIRPVRLPTLKNVNTMDRLVFTGRGLNEYGYSSRNLQKIFLRKLSTEECLQYVPSEILTQVRRNLKSLEAAIICATRVDLLPGPCFGDSGSPLTHENTLVGLASFLGAPCEIARLGFYTNVVNYVPWIKSVTGLS